MMLVLPAILWFAPPGIHPLAAAAACVVLAGAGLAAVLTGWMTPAAGETRFLAALSLPLVLSWPAALDRGAAVDRLVLLAGALLLYGLARRLQPREGRLVLTLLVAGGAALAAHGLWQLAVGFPRLLADPSLDPAVAGRLQTGRVFARFVLPSVFASFLLMAAPVAAGLARSARGLARAAAWAALILMLAGLALTRSHGAFAALAVAALGWALVRTRRRALWAGLALTAAVAGFAAVAWARGGVLLADAEGAGPAALRLRNARAGVEMLAAAPVTGVGGGGYGAAYPAYRRPGDNETRSAHNAYLQVLAEHGMTMLLPLVLAGLAWRRAVRRGTSGACPARAGAAFGLIAFALHAAADVGGLLPATLWTAALVAGLLAGPPPAPSPAISAAGGRPPAAAILACVVLALGGIGVLSGLGRAELARAQDRIARGGPEAGLAAARRAARLAPWRAEPWLLQAEVLLRHPGLAGGGPESARLAAAAAGDALARRPSWPAAYGVRAAALAAAGDVGAAAADLQRATDLYPLSRSYPRELDALAAGLAAAEGSRP